MPFELSNAPAKVQAYINQALIGLVDMACDIPVFSEDPVGTGPRSRRS